ncbi:MAG: hypothetical protein A3J37_02885 [Alphaproteobacteria bacterium RIFCSPHIGHO2_12_FULL_45_9]|nr:MAG: hypothetical protein A3J37_02885 [Alphaproteobacteria bacterium RIFCSPHIGHO2_12_FULL_45_9]
MTQSTKQAPAAKNAESGFTLVELAIVMIIIGLLIGGILKGQELINNARLSSTVAQTKAIESGVSGFRDKYGAMPGDLLGPIARLPNCAASSLCAGSAGGIGNGDGFVQTATANNPGAVATLGTHEAASALAQLGSAGFVGGMTLQGTTLGNGISHPTTPLGGVWNFGYSDGVVAPTAATGTALAFLPGHYIVAANAAGAVAAAGTVPFTPAQAASIDRKLDDGQPNTGSVRGLGAATAATTCADLATVAGVYQESNVGNICGLYVKVQ